MDNIDTLGRIIQDRCDRRLQAHLSSINLSAISRLSTEKLECTALPNVALIELLSDQDFDVTYADLYLSNFHGGERERPDLITTRLRDDFHGKRDGLQPYRVIGLRDSSGSAVGAAHFSVLLPKDTRHAVPYLQYIYVRWQNRRQNLSELMHTLVLAVAIADAARTGGANLHVPFTLMETEPPVHGIDETKRANAEVRTQIHARSGSFALMLRRSCGEVLSAHIQPGLEVEDPPLTLIWALRANPAIEMVLEDQMGKLLIAAYYQSLRDEGFPEKNIALAEHLLEDRYRGNARFCLLHLSEITKEMYVDIDVDTLSNKPILAYIFCTCAPTCRQHYAKRTSTVKSMLGVRNVAKTLSWIRNQACSCVG